VRYHALACDYDGTLATHGVVDQDTLDALDRFRLSGRKLILVTGRELGELHQVFPHSGRFERVVAENGALLYRPATGEEVLLAEPPPAEFIAALRERQRPSADRDCEQGGGSHHGAQQQRPQRRHVLQDRLDHRPSRPPANGNGAQEQNGLVRSQ